MSTNKPVARQTDFNNGTRLTVSVFQNAGKERPWYGIAIQHSYWQKDAQAISDPRSLNLGKADLLSLSSLLEKAYHVIVDLEEKDSATMRTGTEAGQ